MPLEPAQVETPVEAVYAPQPREASAPERWRVIPAFREDPDYAQGPEVEARRVVYRVTLRVPRNLGAGHASIPPLSAELVFDVSALRLRARFVGPGWPVADGSEVRIRRDEPGTYVFDGEGGRPLGPGQLAQWFEGGSLRRDASLRVSSPREGADVGPGDLLCRFIAEWSRTSPSALERRCGEGGTPPSFRVGLWRAVRTADVPMTLPRAALRADHFGPPAPMAFSEAQLFLTEAQLMRLRRLRGIRQEASEGAPTSGFVVENRSRARMIVTIGGTPTAWINVGETLAIPVPNGAYPIGAMRPLGLQTAQKRARVAPDLVRLPR
ncbi:MAG: hypothetical protein AAF645_27745 [Myxococcota bacterium]